MEFNLDDYINLDTDELKSVIKKADENIRALKLILVERDNQAYSAIINYDLDLLKKSLEHNKDKKLDSQIWAVLTFRTMNENHIDFLKYMMSLPEYKENDNSNYGPISRTTEAVLQGFKNKKLFDFFIENKEFEKSFKTLLDYQYDSLGLNPDVPKEIIHELFQRKMLEPNIKLVINLAENKCFNFLDYLHENKLYEFSKEEYKKLYLACWNKPNENIYKWVTEEYNEYINIKLDDIVTHGSKKDNTSCERSYRSFLDLDDEVFLNLIRTQPSNKVEITYIVNNFNYSTEYNKFHKFVELLVSEKPEMISLLKSAKNFVKNNNFKNEFNKAMEYIDMKENLGNSKEEIKKKPKI